MRIDLGCGNIPFENCIGIDIRPAEQVDIVHNFNEPLPLENNIASFVLASNSLQYADNLQALMQDIYRICQHKAIICIVAPYAHVTSHMVNPLYKQLFNEHVPRYWSKHAPLSIDEDEYMLSWPEEWSLMEQPNSGDEAGQMDFRLLRMELFYFPQYGDGYEARELMLLRQSQLNVAYQIMYHLIVVKQPISNEEILYMGASELEEPLHIAGQRAEQHKKTADEQLFFINHLDSLLENERPEEQSLKSEPQSGSATTVDSGGVPRSGSGTIRPSQRQRSKRRPGRRPRK